MPYNPLTGKHLHDKSGRHFQGRPIGVCADPSIGCGKQIYELDQSGRTVCLDCQATESYGYFGGEEDDPPSRIKPNELRAAPRLRTA